MESIKINPLINLKIDGLDDVWTISVGEGMLRNHLNIDNTNLLDWLFSFVEPKQYDESVVKTSDFFGIDKATAIELIDTFIKEQVLVDSTYQNKSKKENLEKWEAMGWRDALDFHLGTRDLIFDPSYDGYAEAMEEYLEFASKGLDEDVPSLYKTYSGKEKIKLLDSHKILDTVTFGQLESRYEQVREFENIQIPFDKFSELMTNTYGVQNEVDSTIGKVLRKTSPSGGARHPIETYVVVKNIENIPQGLYHYSSKDNSLTLLKDGNLSKEIQKLCFDKVGIITSGAVILYTIRWGRHMWKYRYARSYRMVLHDVGHLSQTHMLTATALDIKSFICTTVYDSGFLDFFGIKENCEEGIVYAMGIGMKGK